MVSRKIVRFNERYRKLVKGILALYKLSGETSKYNTLKELYKDYDYSSKKDFERVQFLDTKSDGFLGELVPGASVEEVNGVRRDLVAAVVESITLDSDYDSEEDLAEGGAKDAEGMESLMKALEGTSIGKISQKIANKVGSEGSDPSTAILSEIGDLMKSGEVQRMASEAMKLLTAGGGNNPLAGLMGMFGGPQGPGGPSLPRKRGSRGGRKGKPGRPGKMSGPAPLPEDF